MGYDYKEFRRSIENHEMRSDDFEPIMEDSGPDFTMVPRSEWENEEDD